ncbi:putative MFS family arabinose efflux permease [Streptomyces sp. Amel2xB2]|uniref:MFS transporter n=1 Tax=Streptomyces sp. Amel2xB2 TaxID=1305829 RepID=UPI000DC013CD|nr:MFS transporter [Streptomyces sp. Amel2xB2]RAJ66649.1 putative MFS family arabinose efflux permease [Streptomyces sp. Amel2xB2]
MPTGSRRGLALICLAVFGGYTGQQILTPVLPPLARELGLSEVQFGIVMSASAGVVALVSPWWGRRSDTHGRRSLLILALFGAAAGLLAFALAAHAGLLGLTGALLTFALLLLTRGVLFGGSLAALPVAAQAYVADGTPDERQRVQGLARIGAAIGLALVLGPGLGGLLADFGLVTALYLAPVLAVLPAFAVWALLPGDRRPAPTDGRRAPRLSPFDGRVRPFLLAGGGIYLSVSMLQSSIGFLLQDRLGLGARETAELSGYVLLAGGLPMLLVQGLVIPYLGWRPVRLLRTGVPVTAVAFAVMASADSLPVFFAACVLSGLGHSLAIPGYNSGLSLRVGPDEQGGAAGLTASVNGCTLVLGPLAATALYQAGAALPFVCGAAVLAVLAAFLLLSPGLRDREGAADAVAVPPRDAPAHEAGSP